MISLATGGVSPFTLSQLTTEDFITAIAAGIVGLFSLIVAYTRRPEMEWQRIVAEIVLEVALATSLTFSIKNFAEEIRGVFARRIQVAVGISYASAVVSLICFVISTVCTIVIMMSKSPATQLNGVKLSQGLSRFSWILYLFVSLGSIFPFMTVRGAVRSEEKTRGDVVTGSVVLPFAVAFLVVLYHLFTCLCSCQFRWNITKYHRKWMSFLLTVFAFAAMVAPVLFAARRLRGKEPPKTATMSLVVIISVIVEILAALLHRFGLYRLKKQREALETKIAISAEADSSVAPSDHTSDV